MQTQNGKRIVAITATQQAWTFGRVSFILLKIDGDRTVAPSVKNEARAKNAKTYCTSRKVIALHACSAQSAYGISVMKVKSYKLLLATYDEVIRKIHILRTATLCRHWFHSFLDMAVAPTRTPISCIVIRVPVDLCWGVDSGLLHLAFLHFTCFYSLVFLLSVSSSSSFLRFFSL